MARQDRLIPYLRQSRKRERLVSFEEQRALIARVPDDVKLLDEVLERGVSGSIHWRERALGEVIERIRNGEADGIVVGLQDRLSRENQLATAEVWQALDEAGARLICVADGIDTGDGNDHELLFTIRAAIARDQWKRFASCFEKLKERTVLEDGAHQSGKVPTGYKAGPRKPNGRPSPLVVHGVRGPAIGAAFELYALPPTTLGDVVRFLEAELPGGPSGKSGAWTRQNLSRILSNRVYLGEARQGKKYVKPDAHPALVDAEVFQTVQLKLKGNKRERVEHPKAKHLLAGLVHCATCGYKMQRTRASSYQAKDGSVYFTYRCKTGTRATAGVCEAPASISAKQLEPYLLAEVKRHALLAANTGIEKRRRQRDDARVPELRTKLDENLGEQAVLKNPKYARAIGVDSALAQLEALVEEQERLEEQLAKLLGPKPEPKRLVEDLVALLDDPDVAVDVKREAIGGMIQAVHISPAPRLAPVGPGRVDIYWTGGPDAPAAPSRGRPKRAVLEVGVAAA